MQLKSIKIEKFRHIENVDFTFGSKLTAIVGKNGIGKSSLLGLIGHVCTAPTNDKTIENKNFETQYSEIFSFSYPKYDKSGQHQYEIEFENVNGNTHALVASYDRKEAGSANGLRLRVSSFDEHNGVKTRSVQRKIKFPVIYLGLKRLFPLVQENSSVKEKSGLSSDDSAFYIDSYNKIMSTEGKITPERIISRTKNFIAVQTDNYDVYGNSAGQDNLGQILTAIISFKTLQRNLGGDYVGGLLLIDEIDATLFPGALFKLLNFLLKQAGDLNLQIIFTSHSIDLLSKLQERNFKHHSRCTYLHRDRGAVKCKDVNDDELGILISDLKQEVFQNGIAPRNSKKSVWTEDAETVLFLENITNRDLLSQLKIESKYKFGMKELMGLVQRGIPVFKDAVIVLDGDARTEIKKKGTNIVFLPTEKRPENLIYEFLAGLNESDDFWGGVGEYNKEFFLGNKPLNLSDRDIMKKWFNSHLPYWGRKGKTVFTRWIKDNSQLVEVFNNELKIVLSKLGPK